MLIEKDGLEIPERDALLEYVTFKLYQSMSDIHGILSDKVGESQANDIMVDAIAINLGHVIGQMEPKKQKRYASVARATIKEHMLSGAIAQAEHQYGSVGHA